MAKSKLNKPLLRRLARKLRRLRHEEHYDQGVYFSRTNCGTAACIAGHTLLLAGWRPVPDTSFQWIRKGREADVVEQASKELGLTFPQANILFNSYPRGVWPMPYSDRWGHAAPESSYPACRPSRIAADLLDAIADTDGKVLEDR